MLLGFRAQNHEQQVLVRGALDEVDDRETDPRIFEGYHERFGFTLDAAANHYNAKCERYFTRQDDGLAQPWAGERVWCNPPYSDLGAWIRKAFHAVDEEGAALVVMLIPANRTEQRFWQDLIEPVRDRHDGRLAVEFIRGRLRFLRPGEEQIPPNSRPPFGCCLLIFKPRELA